MNKTIYKLSLNQQNNQACLTLFQNNTSIRKWFGVFAVMVYETAVNKVQNLKPDNGIYCLKKSHLHQFFIDVTYLYQQALLHYKIEKDLLNLNFPNNCNCIAESLLLQIRMSENHPSYDQLLSNYLDVFQNRDFKIFDKTVSILINNKLVQLIKTEDGMQFFDKNPAPHNHIYFKKHTKLVDCTNEITTFLTGLGEKIRPNLKQRQIFYINNSLSVCH